MGNQLPHRYDNACVGDTGGNMIGLLMLAAAVQGAETGVSLLKACEANPASHCASYIAGVIDADMAVDDRAFCLPAHISVALLSRAVADWLTTYPKSGPLEAPVVIIAALETRFPCHK